MRKAELEVGRRYVTRHDGDVTVLDLNPSPPSHVRTRTTKVLIRRHDGDGEYLVSPQTIIRAVDHPEEVAKRERLAELDRQSDQARELLRLLGFTVAEPGRRRRFGEDPEPEAGVQGTWKGREVAIRLDAFLRTFDVEPESLAEAVAILNEGRELRRLDRVTAATEVSRA